MCHLGIRHQFCTQTLGVDKGFRNQVSVEEFNMNPVFDLRDVEEVRVMF